ncbi:MAG: alkaline phosphatase family protein, partial [Actinomycetes bacterium]
FDNLYGSWEGVEGLSVADAAHMTQVDQAGAAYACLKQDDVNLTSPPLPATCTDKDFSSAFPNRFFTIDDFIAPTDTTCPAPGVSAPNGVLKGHGEPGGCTRDLVHRFYQEQYQLNGGAQNRYVTGSDAVGLTMGVYDTKKLPIYAYLHEAGHPSYVIADNFFQAAFGGSFLNHQWLIAAASPTFPGAVADDGPDDLHSKVDDNGFPNATYPLYKPTRDVRDGALTVACDTPHPAGLACGDYAVNTIQPPFQPRGSGAQLPAQTAPTIGDRLSARHVDWAWYSGGWSNANGDIGAPGWTNSNTACTDPNTLPTAVFPNCPDKLFQFHHQPFNYYRTYAPGTAARTAHLRDEQEFLQLARSSDKACNLKPVSFIKPVGAENEHPGYASVTAGSSHLIDLLQAVDHSRCASDTMVVVTYDEFGGQWDHVTPPGQDGRRGPHDAFGPGTRIPALVISPFLRGGFVVDHTQHDTTSVLATIERRFHLRPLSTRDAAVHDLSSVFHARKP